MKYIMMSLLVNFLLAATAQAKMVNYSCLTKNSYENKEPITIKFTLNFISARNISLTNMKISPYSKILGALQNYDEAQVVRTDSNIQIMLRQFGGSDATILLEKRFGFDGGYVTSGGDGNKSTYSVIGCRKKTIQ